MPRSRDVVRSAPAAASERVDQAAAISGGDPGGPGGVDDTRAHGIPDGAKAWWRLDGPVTRPRLTNALDGTLPVEAVLLARTVAVRPPVGTEISSTRDRRPLPARHPARLPRQRVGRRPVQGHRLIVEQLRCCTR